MKDGMEMQEFIDEYRHVPLICSLASMKRN
jgi:hypothetical protein